MQKAAERPKMGHSRLLRPPHLPVIHTTLNPPPPPKKRAGGAPEGLKPLGAPSKLALTLNCEDPAAIYRDPDALYT